MINHTLSILDVTVWISIPWSINQCKPYVMIMDIDTATICNCGNYQSTINATIIYLSWIIRWSILNENFECEKIGKQPDFSHEVDGWSREQRWIGWTSQLYMIYVYTYIHIYIYIYICNSWISQFTLPPNQAVVLRVGGAFPQLYLNGQPEEVEERPKKTPFFGEDLG